ncbi:hypothetical protein ANN_15449 [Periplaneta americana]|uniref:Uncharacterized protein n=1 Tax=Periplaneta americana TaxID=6978 RepID=A0ABQ8SHR3_PERAM|nr:hypothetical protein ANN_15449 [Periplaneta americana]
MPWPRLDFMFLIMSGEENNACSSALHIGSSGPNLELDDDGIGYDIDDDDDDDMMIKMMMMMIQNFLYTIITCELSAEGKTQHLLSYFSTYSPLELRHLSYHGIDREVQTTVKRWFRSQAADFYETRIQKLILWYHHGKRQEGGKFVVANSDEEIKLMTE